jgi:hypothetical protein
MYCFTVTRAIRQDGTPSWSWVGHVMHELESTQLAPRVTYLHKLLSGLVATLVVQSRTGHHTLRILNVCDSGRSGS